MRSLASQWLLKAHCDWNLRGYARESEWSVGGWSYTGESQQECGTVVRA